MMGMSPALAASEATISDAVWFTYPLETCISRRRADRSRPSSSTKFDTGSAEIRSTVPVISDTDENGTRPPEDELRRTVTDSSDAISGMQKLQTSIVPGSTTRNVPASS